MVEIFSEAHHRLCCGKILNNISFFYGGKNFSEADQIVLFILVKSFYHGIFFRGRNFQRSSPSAVLWENFKQHFNFYGGKNFSEADHIVLFFLVNSYYPCIFFFRGRNFE